MRSSGARFQSLDLYSARVLACAIGLPTPTAHKETRYAYVGLGLGVRSRRQLQRADAVQHLLQCRQLGLGSSSPTSSDTRTEHRVRRLHAARHVIGTTRLRYPAGVPATRTMRGPGLGALKASACHSPLGLRCGRQLATPRWPQSVAVSSSVCAPFSLVPAPVLRLTQLSGLARSRLRWACPRCGRGQTRSELVARSPVHMDHVRS